jgi:hypothetical protein
MKVYLQYWEESERDWGVRPDGCSIHLDLESHANYIDEVYRDRTFHQHVPNEYDRIVGDPIKVRVSEKLYEDLLKKKSLRLSEVETNNLIKFNEIILNDLA